MIKRFIPLYLPFVCLLGFFVFWFVSAEHWAGGNYWDRHHEGYNWTANYLCDLFGIRCLNGQTNTGRMYAMISLACLLLGFLSFWINLVNFWFFSRQLKWASNIYGLLVVVFFGLVPWFHNLAVTSAMLLGWMGFLILLVLLLQKKEYGSMFVTILMLIFASANYIIWFTGTLLEALPLLQLTAFMVFTGWIVYLSARIFSYQAA